MKPLLNDHTTAILDTPDGGTVQRPTTLLTADDAALLGEMESYLSRERLSRTLWCNTCGFDTDVQVYVRPDSIGILCDCRLLFYQGPVPVVLTTHPDEGERLIAPYRAMIPDVSMDAADAYLWRRYDTLLRLHGYKEALWCGQCDDEDQPHGLRAEISASQVSLCCRHAHRLYRGITI